MKSILTVITLSIIIIGCKSTDKTESSVIATIDDHEITLDEFRSFYQFDVNFGLDSSGIGALKDELWFYIDQVKALQLAQDDGLINDSIFVRAYEWEKKQAMLRQLYRQEITENIIVSEKEARELYRNRQTQIELRHLFFKSQVDAEQAYRQLSEGISFEEMALNTFANDSLAKSGGYLGWIKISELDDQFAFAVSNLPVKTISKPVESKWGFHIVEVLDKKENPIITESEFLSSVPSLKKKIKNQKSQKLSADYIKDYIGELNPQLGPIIFNKFWDIVVPQANHERAKLSKKIELTQSKIDRAKFFLKNKIDQPFITHKNGIITLGEFLNTIEEIPNSHRFAFQSKRELANHIGKWIRDELLLEEAYNKGLDEYDRVIKETNRFMEEQSYYYYQGLTSDTLKVPDYVKNYYIKNDSVLRIKYPSLSKYHTLQDWKFDYSKKLLHTYFKQRKSNIFIDNKILQEENKKVNWDNKIRMFMVRKPS